VKRALGCELERVLAAEGAESYFVDSNLARFVEGHHFDVEKVAALLRETIAWRASIGAHAARVRLLRICATRAPTHADLSHYEHVCAHMMLGTKSFLRTKRGDLLDIALLGRIEPSKAVRCVDHLSDTKFNVFWMEWLEQLNVQLTQLTRERARVRAVKAAEEEEGPHAERGGAGGGRSSKAATATELARLHTIVDMTGLGAAHMAPSAARFFVERISRVAERHYPECCATFYVVNQPWAFASAYALVAPFLPERTRAKVLLCGSQGSSAYNATMASIFDDPAAALPEIIGGERPNRECLNLPRRLDVACSSTALASDWTLTLVVNAGERVVVDIPLLDTAARGADGAGAAIPADVALTRRALRVGAAGTTGRGCVRYEYCVANTAFDIGFSVSFAPSAEGTGQAPRSWSCSKANVEFVQYRSAAGRGSFALWRQSAPVPSAGTLRLAFDNTFSWTRSKIVTLRIQAGDASPAEVELD
jgi:hypothetical protein